MFNIYRTKYRFLSIIVRNSLSMAMCTPIQQMRIVGFIFLIVYIGGIMIMAFVLDSGHPVNVVKDMLYIPPKMEYPVRDILYIPPKREYPVQDMLYIPPKKECPEDITESLRKLCYKYNLTLENAQNGPGEYGKSVKTEEVDLLEEEAMEWKRGYDYAGYNVYISDRIALRRRMPDLLHPMCKNITYSQNLPQASIIIPFYKEALSAVLRTVLSSLDRSPDNLLKEVILVDDFSEADQLLAPLDEFVALLPKVRVIRNKQREGLMRSRMNGIMAATAPVIVIKDAHTEYFPGWLEPLLTTISANKTTIAISNLQGMSPHDFGMWNTNPKSVHVFDLMLRQGVYNMPVTSPIQTIILKVVLQTV